jgi:hypothetical protein
MFTVFRAVGDQSSTTLNTSCFTCHGPFLRPLLIGDDYECKE